MGIMGSFLDSNFSLDVVTESPWDNRQTNKLPDSTFFVETLLATSLPHASPVLPAET
jgi:hypothetical protein